MSITITMPALSPTMEEGALAKWLVKPGDRIEPGQVIAEIETDKATMEVEAVDEGVVSEILIAAGTQGVKVNTPIAILAGEGGAAPKPASTPSAAPPPKAPVAPPPSMASSPARTDGGRIAASPLARRMALQAGIDLAGLKGSGPHGRIVKADVEHALGRPRSQAAAPQLPTLVAVQMPTAAEPRAPQAMPYPDGEYEVVPLDGMRRAIARRMTAAFRDVPHFPLTIDVEIDSLLGLRKQLLAKLGDGAPKISVNDLLIRACALALKKVPDANASFAGEAIWKHKHAHVAVAVAIPGGLITPVIFKAETKGLAEISAEMKDLAERARARKLKPHEYEGGTFSISNLGMMGIKSFASILNEPQGMILSVGAGEQRAVVKEGALAVATLMTLTLTCDHRVVDGAVGAEFLGVLKRLLEDPMTMML